LLRSRLDLCLEPLRDLEIRLRGDGDLLIRRRRFLLIAGDRERLRLRRGGDLRRDGLLRRDLWGDGDLLLTTELSLSESLPGMEPLRSSLGGDKDGDNFFLSLARRSLDLLRRLRDMDRLRDRDLLRLLDLERLVNDLGGVLDRFLGGVLDLFLDLERDLRRRGGGVRVRDLRLSLDLERRLLAKSCLRIFLPETISDQELTVGAGGGTTFPLERDLLFLGDLERRPRDRDLDLRPPRERDLRRRPLDLERDERLREVEPERPLDFDLFLERDLDLPPLLAAACEMSLDASLTFLIASSISRWDASLRCTGFTMLVFECSILIGLAANIWLL